MSKDDFIWVAIRMPNHWLAQFLNTSENEIKTYRLDGTIDDRVSAKYDTQSTEQLETVTDTMMRNIENDNIVSQVEQEPSYAQVYNYGEDDEAPSRSSVMILSVCIGAFLGAITMILVPAEYRPSSAPIDETTEITFGLMMEQMMSIQGLVGLLPIIYFLLSLLIINLFIQRSTR